MSSGIIVLHCELLANAEDKNALSAKSWADLIPKPPKDTVSDYCAHLFSVNKH